MNKVSTIFACILTGCTSQISETGLTANKSEIQYISLDLDNVAVFTKQSARFGPALALSPVWPSSKVKYFSPTHDIACVSVGPEENSEDYGIKRPIKYGDSFQCKNTAFTVIKCFRNCRSAILERKTVIHNIAKSFIYKSYLYIDSCLGIVMFSDAAIVSGAPLNASLLRGNVGVLADGHYPACQGLK